MKLTKSVIGPRARMSPVMKLFWLIFSNFAVPIFSLSIMVEPTPCAPTNVGYEVGNSHVAFARGCYHSRRIQTFPPGAKVNFRGSIDWDLWAADSSAKSTIEKCAKVALERGAPTFGVEFYGECYFGADPDLSQGEVTTTDGCGLCRWDVGAAHVVFVYDLFEWFTE